MAGRKPNIELSTECNYKRPLRRHQQEMRSLDKSGYNHAKAISKVRDRTKREMSHFKREFGPERLTKKDARALRLDSRRLTFVKI